MFLLFGTAKAGSNWLEKGTDLLKTYGESSEQTGITVEEIAAGLKDALRVGSENVVSQLGRVDGFNTDSAVHIPLPKELDTVRSVLDKDYIRLSNFKDFDVEVIPFFNQLFISLFNVYSFKSNSAAGGYKVKDLAKWSENFDSETIILIMKMVIYLKQEVMKGSSKKKALSKFFNNFLTNNLKFWR